MVKWQSLHPHSDTKIYGRNDVMQNFLAGTAQQVPEIGVLECCTFESANPAHKAAVTEGADCVFDHGSKSLVQCGLLWFEPLVPEKIGCDFVEAAAAFFPQCPSQVAGRASLPSKAFGHMIVTDWICNSICIRTVLQEHLHQLQVSI